MTPDTVLYWPNHGEITAGQYEPLANRVRSRHNQTSLRSCMVLEPVPMLIQHPHRTETGLLSGLDPWTKGQPARCRCGCFLHGVNA